MNNLKKKCITKLLGATIMLLCASQMLNASEKTTLEFALPKTDSGWFWSSHLKCDGSVDVKVGATQQYRSFEISGNKQDIQKEFMDSSFWRGILKSNPLKKEADLKVAKRNIEAQLDKLDLSNLPSVKKIVRLTFRPKKEYLGPLCCCLCYHF